MNHLDALCCDAHRDIVARIEERAKVDSPAFALHDRRELLSMIETLLDTVAQQRADAKTLAGVMSEPIQQWLKMEAERLLTHVAPGGESNG